MDLENAQLDLPDIVGISVQDHDELFLVEVTESRPPADVAASLHQALPRRCIHWLQTAGKPFQAVLAMPEEAIRKNVQGVSSITACKLLQLPASAAAGRSAQSRVVVHAMSKPHSLSAVGMLAWSFSESMKTMPNNSAAAISDSADTKASRVHSWLALVVDRTQYQEFVLALRTLLSGNSDYEEKHEVAKQKTKQVAPPWWQESAAEVIQCADRLSKQVSDQKDSDDIGDASTDNSKKDLAVSERALPDADSFYLYSLQQVRQRASAMTAMKALGRVWYAIKANAYPPILRAIFNLGVGFECVSFAEVQWVRQQVPEVRKHPERILFTPNFASRSEYEKAFELGTFVTLDNLWPLEQWSNVFSGKSFLLRIDPGQGHGHHAHTRTGGSRSKFGVSVDELINAKAKLVKLKATVVGLHIHAGSGVNDVTNWVRNAQLLNHLRSHFPTVKYLNLGGGLGVGYRPDELPVDTKVLDDKLLLWRAEHLESMSASSASSAAPVEPVELWMEPGRFLVAEAGVLVSKVTQRKTKPGRNFVGTSTGMNALIRPALYDAYHHIVNLTHLAATKQKDPSINDTQWEKVDVVGPICETGDVLGHDRLLPSSTAEGDWILVACAGAYGHTMASSYNMRAPPVEAVAVN